MLHLVNREPTGYDLSRYLHCCLFWWSSKKSTVSSSLTRCLHMKTMKNVFEWNSRTTVSIPRSTGNIDGEHVLSSEVARNAAGLDQPCRADRISGAIQVERTYQDNKGHTAISGHQLPRQRGQNSTLSSTLSSIYVHPDASKS